MSRIFVRLFTVVLTLIALANVAVACGPMSYQPDVPAALRK
ncbi:AgrD family cyclic lactone autoinducer peptide [Candidatus Formimonas warabiya]